jgi:hypothetical protein
LSSSSSFGSNALEPCIQHGFVGSLICVIHQPRILVLALVISAPLCIIINRTMARLSPTEHHNTPISP